MTQRKQNAAAIADCRLADVLRAIRMKPVVREETGNSCRLATNTVFPTPAACRGRRLYVYP